MIPRRSARRAGWVFLALPFLLALMAVPASAEVVTVGDPASPVTRPVAATGAAEGLMAVAGLALIALGLMLRRSLKSP